MELKKLSDGSFCIGKKNVDLLAVVMLSIKKVSR
jgi:hypothetical protein